MSFRIKWLGFILLFSSSLWAQDFSLDELSSLFPRQGFEDSIRFWISIFTEHGENEVVFHDRYDVRLVYHVEKFSKGIEGDPAERRRQQRRLKKVLAEVRTALRALARGGTPGNDLQSSIRKSIELAGLTPNSAELRKLSQSVRMQRGVATKFASSLRRAGQYLPYIEAIFREKGLPAELALIPHVESSFYYGARSSVGAAGIWQLMRGTSRSLLTISRYLDERLDPLAATRAAATILQENYEILGNWPLAITAYNHGVNGIRRAQQKYGDNLLDVIENHRSRLFGFASKNFYAEFLAAIYVARNREHFFPGVEPDPALEFDQIRLTQRYRIQEVIDLQGLELEELRHLNPHLTARVWRSGVFPGGFDLRVPAGQGEPLRAGLERLQPVPYSGPVEIGEDGRLRYRVQRGDTLARIALRFGVSQRSLQGENRIANRNRIYLGQVLLLPLDAGAPNGSVASNTTYVVQRGDSLARIARQFATSVSGLKELNGLRDPNQIYPGQRLLLRGSTRYRVRRGDTLAGIARRFNTSIGVLKAVNGIGNANRIFQGQVLHIPAAR